ncbi:BadF/BadG/BcrA/BcrD ATPase family protein [Microbacterium sp. KSW-18]|uniref:BadF/BadG/BcrA/BcrD ATPase family protein n=1 Tax=Microbacterium aquilitoris TaxID=3067307 RepID=A0ABU3GIA0_9MICO|nr:BadF/BadG/BcrA/BcrD ATPase family protein [Microbacterium sp. KSW-18]MDT3330431.1 BadF/BadG/BcrA/BcrD ATPase family protein [Microbacterium sp. KSW-18]
MNARRVLAIDAGQSDIKVRVDDGTRREDLTFRGIHTGIPLLPQLADVVRETLARTGTDLDVVTAGISGLTDRDADADALLALVHSDGVQATMLAHDSTTSFLGALGDRHGAVVAAGTGVVTLAVGETETARVDGWGWIMGDAGSGYWIGRAALDAVMRAYDGRGPATVLTEAALSRWPDLTQAYMALQADHDRVRVVASLAREVAAAADAGDAVARDISRRAAHELASSARTAVRRVRTDEPAFDVCAIGGVFASRTLHDAFESELGEDLRLVSPRGVGIDGALALAEITPAHPLGAAVHRAGGI